MRGNSGQIGLLLLLLVVIAIIAFFIGTRVERGGGLEILPNVSPSVSPQASPSAVLSSSLPSLDPVSAEELSLCPLADIQEAVKENIITAVKAGNWQALEGYLREELVVIQEATDCCGVVSKETALQALEFLNGAQGEWNFNENNATAISLMREDPTDYKDAIIGVAENNFTVAFQLNNQNQIIKITMARDYQNVL